MEILTLVFSVALAVTASSLYRMSVSLKQTREELSRALEENHKLMRENRSLTKEVELLKEKNNAHKNTINSLLANISNISTFFSGEK